MKSKMLKVTLTAAAALIVGQAFAEVTFFESENFRGRTYTSQQAVKNLQRAGFNDRASSVIVDGKRGELWEVCEDVRFAGHCMVLRPGQYPSLSAMGLNDRVSSFKPVDRKGRDIPENLAPASLPSQVMFYEHEGFKGRNFSSEKSVENFSRTGFNDRVSSMVVIGQRWEVCVNSNFKGSCKVLSPGRYPSLAAMGMNDRISSVRAINWKTRVDDRRSVHAPMPVYDSRRRGEERIYQANVTSVRAVVGPPEQRCWMEREEVAATRGDLNMGGAVLGGLIGGILGHQVGGGTGKDIATIGGLAAGAAIGANVGRDKNGNPATTRDVKRCETRPSNDAPAFWDVTYNFQGVNHEVQMTAPPGATIPVNGRGEPRS